ncbi:hypothetical protein TtJL18_0823 [Thermus thermophilus JL-18]|uniref:Uncharacterized protein n=1 Tax=Thermus thermophilus JL-18 TaxID=798128 RepID=H9ZQW5_THETH|nr:hypothetical protein TtJL18_0823 [Thermus thermophilus JL-18]
MTRPFHRDLVFGRAAERSPWVRQALALLYPDSEIASADAKDDRKGVDLWVIKPSGARVGAQVKARRVSFWGDVFLEVYSDAAKGVPGWISKPEAELLLVVYRDVVLVFHLPTLAYLTRMNLEKWLSKGYGHRTRSEKRPGKVYESLGVFVPLQELGPALLLSVPKLKTGDAA